MHNMRTGIQGEKGSYSEQAVLRVMPAAEIVYFNRFQQVFQALKNNEIEKAVLPFENSTFGSVHENYDHLLRYKPVITGEYYLHVRHQLLSLQKSSLAMIDTVISHPQAIGQCSEFLDRYNWQIEAAADTAGSAKKIAENQLLNTAAIASEQAAIDYNLKILVGNIGNYAANYTRFLTLEKKKDLTDTSNGSGTETKTTLIFSAHDIPGALFKCIAVFYLRDINLHKIESRPDPQRPFNYIFYIDLEGSTSEKRVKAALSHLDELADFVLLAGSYPKSEPDFYADSADKS